MYQTRHTRDDPALRPSRAADHPPRLRDRHDQGQRPPLTVHDPAGTSRAIPSKIDWLHSEMLKTRVAHGFCSRDPIAGACPYANICEQCDNFVPDPDQTDLLTAQRDDIKVLRDDAVQRGWTDEAARHHRVADALDSHLRRIERAAGANQSR